MVSEQVLGPKIHELCTHEEHVNVWKMHTCEYSIGSSPHIFWVCMTMYVQMCFSDFNRLINRGNVHMKFPSNHELYRLNPKKITKP